MSKKSNKIVNDLLNSDYIKQLTPEEKKKAMANEMINFMKHNRHLLTNIEICNKAEED